MSNDEALIEFANSIDEAARAMCHVLINRRSVPAPLVYDLTGHLGQAAYRLKEVAEHLARGLPPSLSVYDVYDRNRDPELSVEMACQQLHIALRAFHQAGEGLAAAQSAVNLQGYHGLRSETDGSEA